MYYRDRSRQGDGSGWSLRHTRKKQDLTFMIKSDPDPTLEKHMDPQPRVLLHARCAASQ